MKVVITLEDLSTFEGHGSVAVITGTDEFGRRVTFAGEPRLLDDVASAVFYDEEDVFVEVEDWQIRRIREAAAS